MRLGIQAVATLALATRNPRRCGPPLLVAGSYSVRLANPLGIIFEETKPGEPEGVVVAGLVDDGNAFLDGRILVGDRLMRVSAVQFSGQRSLVTLGGGTQYTSFKRDLIPCTTLDFETIMSAIRSNEGRFGYTDVVLEMMHTDESVPRAASATRERLSGQDVQWDGARGTVSNGQSTPLRPAPDNFDVDV